MTVLEKNMTVKEYMQLELPNDANYRYELINGVLVKKNAPSGTHQNIQAKLLEQFILHIVPNKEGRIFSSPISVFFDKEQDSAPQPDLVFLKTENLNKFDEEYGIIGVPDIMIEIISPSSFNRDTKTKKALYQKFGVKEYWIVYPSFAIEIYTLNKKQYYLHESGEPGDTITSSVLKNFSLEVSSVF